MSRTWESTMAMLLKYCSASVEAKTILPFHWIAGITLSSEIIINLWLHHGYWHLLGPDNLRTQSTHPQVICPLFLQIMNSCLLAHNTLPLTFPLSVSPTRINSSVCLSVCLSVHLSVRACRLGVERKMAQAQQIRSDFLQNHESTWILNQKFIKTQ